MKICQKGLALAMAESQVTFVKLAALSGVSRTTLSAINNGKSCKPETAGKIATALGKPIASLLREDTK